MTDIRPIQPITDAENASPIAPGVYSMDSDAYHASPGASKSKLDYVTKSPALVEWSQNAPVDNEADAATDVGTALHSLLLEPATFDQHYVPDFDPPEHALVTITDLKAYMDKHGVHYKGGDSKQVLVATLLGQKPSAPVADALQAEWEKGVNGRIVLTKAEHRKLMLMRDSVMAHPTARKLLEADGYRERSHFWIDDLTGELCRSRMDGEIPQFATILDLKTTDSIDRFARSIRKYRYYVQDPFYREGYEATQGHPPAVFAFLVVSTTRDRKRYPVHVFYLPKENRDEGSIEIRRDLATYAEARKSGMWTGFEEISMPPWA